MNYSSVSRDSISPQAAKETGQAVPGAGWSKADLHMHTTYSDGLMTPQEVIDIVAKRGEMQVIAVTDHDTAEGAFVSQAYAQKQYPHLEVIVGQEVTTGEGDVLGLFLHSTLPTFDTAAEAIDAIHAQAGLAVAAHPFVRVFGVDSVGHAIAHLDFDAVEVRHGCPLSIPSNMWAGWINRRGQQLPELGSSDSHIPYSVGQSYTWFPGRTSSDLRRAIEAGHVRVGGTTWTLLSMLRKLPVIFERGWASYSPETKEAYHYKEEREKQMVRTL